MSVGRWEPSAVSEHLSLSAVCSSLPLIHRKVTLSLLDPRRDWADSSVLQSTPSENRAGRVRGEGWGGDLSQLAHICCHLEIHLIFSNLYLCLLQLHLLCPPSLPLCSPLTAYVFLTVSFCHFCISLLRLFLQQSFYSHHFHLSSPLSSVSLGFNYFCPYLIRF